MSRRYQPDIVECDFCGGDIVEGDHKHIEVTHDLISTFSDPLPQRLDFCSLQHAAGYLLRKAAKLEVLGDEAKTLLGRL